MRKQILVIVGLLIAGFIHPGAVFSASNLTISNISISPETITPNNDGVDDFAVISAEITDLGFASKQPMSGGFFAEILDAKGRLLANLKTKFTVENNQVVLVSLLWDGKDRRGEIVGNGTYVCRITVKLKNFSETLNAGQIIVFLPKVLSVSLTPQLWDIGTAELGAVVTMSSEDRIMVFNDGEINTTYSLQVIDPAGWQAAQTPGDDLYVLNAAFSQAIETLTWSVAEHSLSNIPELCSLNKFSGDQTGVSVAPGEIRTLWFQFKSPLKSTIFSSQQIKVVITANPE